MSKMHDWKSWQQALIHGHTRRLAVKKQTQNSHILAARTKYCIFSTFLIRLKRVHCSPLKNLMVIAYAEFIYIYAGLGDKILKLNQLEGCFYFHRAILYKT